MGPTFRKRISVMAARLLLPARPAPNIWNDPAVSPVNPLLPPRPPFKQGFPAYGKWQL